MIVNDHQAFYKHHNIKRPYFDRLAREGALFDCVYTACPLCGPARRTLLTGLYPHNHGELNNGVDHPYDHELYLDTLKELGYDSYYYGKWHAGEGTALEHGCEGFCYPSYNNPYTKKEYKDYLAKHNLPTPKIKIERSFIGNKWRDIDGLEEGQIIEQNRGWCNEHATGTLLTPKETHEAFFLADLACERLQSIKVLNNGKPFSLRVDFWGPHPPYFPTCEYLNMYNPEEISMYPSFRNDLSDKPSVYHTEENFGISKDEKIIIPNPLPWSEWQKVLQKCYAQITMMDEAAGLILDKLKQLKMNENTIIIWTTDHGDAVACHGGHFDKRSYMAEEVLRIPLAMSWKNVIDSNIVVKTPVCNTDIAPTIIDAIGAKHKNKVDGKSLLPLLREHKINEHRYIVSEGHGHMEDHFARAISDGMWKYVYNKNQIDELYNLKDDPYELKNLVSVDKHSAQLEVLKKALVEWQNNTADEVI